LNTPPKFLLEEGVTVTNVDLGLGYDNTFLASKLTTEELATWGIYEEDYPLRELVYFEFLSHTRVKDFLFSGVPEEVLDRTNYLDFAKLLVLLYKEIDAIEEVGGEVVIHGTIMDEFQEEEVRNVIALHTNNPWIKSKLIRIGRKDYKKSCRDSIKNPKKYLSRLKNLESYLDRKEKELEKREEILKNKESKVKSAKYKRSSHLTDQMLKYSYPKSKQPFLFDTLKSETLKDIEIAGVEYYEVVEGIRLTPSETKVIDSLCKLLHQKSQILEPKNRDYYTGNLSPEMVDYMAEITPAPKLGFTLYELTKEYKGEETISGKDVKNVKQVLTELNNKKFCIRYTETTKGKGGEWIKKEYEKFRPIINLDLATLSYGVGNIEHYKKTETVIVLHPIFRRQIDSKFIFYPDDINKRIAIAYGSHNVSEITLRLRDYLMREISSKRPNPEIGEEKLYYLLAEKWMRESRKKKVKEYTEKALSTMIALGILKSYKIEPAKTTGEPKVVFTLNMDWE
jgi:hypothetical protein